MPTTLLDLYTRPRTESHERENWSKIVANYGLSATDLTVLEGLFWQTLTNNETSAISFGQPVYSDGSGSVQLAQANDIATSEIAGLVYDASIAGGATGRIIRAGFVEGTTAQWDAVTGDSGGLDEVDYYLDHNTAGMLTRVAPTSGSGDVVAVLGRGISSTILLLRPQLTVQLQ